MTIASCPKCREQVSIPNGTSSQARVRCPLCQEEYILAAALERLPPLLIVLPDVEPAQHDPHATFEERAPESAVIGVDEAPADFELEPPAGGWTAESPAAVPAFRFEPDSVSPSTPGSSLATRSRARRKQASPLKAMIQVVAGGVLGLVIAQLILWWLPGDWGKANRDPLGVADTIARYVPFVVPAELWGTQTASESPSAETPPSAAPNQRHMEYGSATTTNSNPTDPSFDSKLPDFQFKADRPKNEDANQTPDETARSATIRNKTKAKGKEQKSEQGESVAEPNAESATSPPSDSGKSESANDLRSTDLSPSLTAAASSKTKAQETKKAATKAITSPVEANIKASPGATASAIRNRPQFSATEIAPRLSQVVQAEEAWDSGANVAKDERRKQLVDFYGSLAALGELLVFVDREDPQAVQQWPTVQERVEELAKQPDKLNLIGAYAARWLDEKGVHTGAALYGTVVATQPQGKLFETRLKLPSTPEREVTVVSPINLQEQLLPQTNVIILGAIVADPRENIDGYVGDADMVVFDGYHFALPRD